MERISHETPQSVVAPAAELSATNCPAKLDQWTVLVKVLDVIPSIAQVSAGNEPASRS
jgi:hypothetical protein